MGALKHFFFSLILDNWDISSLKTPRRLLTLYTPPPILPSAIHSSYKSPHSAFFLAAFETLIIAEVHQGRIFLHPSSLLRSANAPRPPTAPRGETAQQSLSVFSRSQAVTLLSNWSENF